jgi:hypothetical protein
MFWNVHDLIKLYRLLLLISATLSESVFYPSQSEYAAFDKSLSAFTSVNNNEMWKPVIISEELPLIFFHQRKAGGDSLRRSMSNAAKRKGFSAFFPCYNDVPCDMFENIPDDRPYAMYGSHFTWGEQAKLEIFGQNRRNNYTCVTNFRDPISRVISCLYYRFRKLIYLTRQELKYYPVADLIDLLRHTDEYGSSCVNEPFRILSGFRDEKVFDDMVKNSDDVRPFYDEQTKLVFDLTVSNLAKCTPCILELPQSYDLLNVKLPFSDKKRPLASSIRKNKNKSKYYNAGNQSLREDQMEAFRKVTAVEQVLYNAVRKKVESRIVQVYGKIEHSGDSD